LRWPLKNSDLWGVIDLKIKHNAKSCELQKVIPVFNSNKKCFNSCHWW